MEFPERYADVEFMAEGGMARVYRARRRISGDLVAVREITGGPGSDERIASECRGAEIQRALCHIDARVPRVFDIFTSAAGWLYVEMEYVDGEDLAAVMQRGPLPAADALRIAVEMFDFLRIAHSTTVSVDGEQRNQQVHGDLTPKNIRIGKSGAVRILDFGISKGLKTPLTVVAFANYGYVSPERARSGHMGISDDFWSAGVVLYEMLSGQRAFPGTPEEIRATLADRHAPPALDPKVPRPLRLMVTKLLAWDPAYRYTDATAVLADLTAFQSGLTTRAEADAEASRTRAAAPPAPDHRTRSTGTPWRRSSVDRAHVQSDRIRHADTTSATRTAPVAQRPRRSRRLIWVAPLLAAAIVVFHERAVWNDVDARRRIAATGTGDLEMLWSDYQALDDRAWLPVTTRRLAQVLTDRLVSEASTTLKDYRQDEPRIRSRQVETAQAQLARALVVQPGNTAAEAWLRYAQGQLARIEGEAQRGDQRRQAWTRAVARFEEAARLAPNLPDPHLALTRLYTHREYRDPDRARRAMAAAERLGHPRGVREHAQMGDLARDEGDLLFRQARDVRHTGSEEPLLVRARAELVSALGEYELSKGFGQSSIRIREIGNTIRRIDTRLEEIRGEETPAAPDPQLPDQTSPVEAQDAPPSDEGSHQ